MSEPVPASPAPAPAKADAKADARTDTRTHRLVVKDHTGRAHSTVVEGSEGDVQKVADELAVLADRLSMLGVTRHSVIDVEPIKEK